MSAQKRIQKQTIKQHGSLYIKYTQREIIINRVLPMRLHVISASSLKQFAIKIMGNNIFRK